MHVEPIGEKFICPHCDPPQDISEQVMAERDEELAVLRSGRGRKQGKWSMITRCPNGHEVAFSGEWP